MALLTTTDGPIDFFYETAAPDTSPETGSITFRIDAGSVGTFQNIDGTAAGWVQLLPAGGSVTFLQSADATWALRDNSATAWSIGSTGLTNLLVFDTQNGAEAIQYNGANALQIVTGGLQIDAGGITLTTAQSMTLLDNNAAALGIGAAGATTMLLFDTQDGAEVVAVQTARLTVRDNVTGGTDRVVGGRAFSSTADSSAVTSTTSATAFDVTYDIPANTLKAGSTVRVRAVIRCTAQAGTTDATYAIRIGGTVVVQGAAITDPAVGEHAVIEAWLTARAAPGAAVTCVGGGYVIDAGNNALVTASTMAPTALATNAALTVDLTALFAAADATAAVLESLIVDVV